MLPRLASTGQNQLRRGQLCFDMPNLFPADLGPPGSAAVHSSPDEQAEAPAKDGTPLRILMAEDNVINQRVGQLILKRAGFNIDLANDGREALEAHRRTPYHVILMDCQMPVMDGFEASRNIRRLTEPQPVIIAVTANALVGEREKCLEAGMDDYLSKPFQADQLVSLIRKWSEVKRSG
ncbi:MAG: multi-sensor hybrid histidine kinase [Bryobacterales bacterium]|nr:multi-sensor hybrid histidine kinase [Bryobacterales bacterium]